MKDDLVQDMIEVLTSFCARRYGRRSAKNKAKKEFAEALEKTGLTLDQCRAWMEAHPESKKPLYHVPHTKGIVGGAANFVMHISEHMKKQPATVN